MKHDRIERTTETKHKQKEQMQKVTALSLLVKNNNTNARKRNNPRVYFDKVFLQVNKNESKLI
jgi:hypothetical protein